MGTPQYMAPEQMRGSCDHRADLFSLGAILYELLHHEPAFRGSTFYDLVLKVGTGDHAPLDALPRPIVDALTWTLQPDPERRIPDCEVLRAVLAGERTWLPLGVRPPKRDLRPAGGLVLGLGLGLGLGLVLLPRTPSIEPEVVLAEPMEEPGEETEVVEEADDPAEEEPGPEVAPPADLPADPPADPPPSPPEEPRRPATGQAEVVVAAGPFGFPALLMTRCDAVEVHRLRIEPGTGLLKNLPLDRNAGLCEVVASTVNGQEVSARVTQTGWCQVTSGAKGLAVSCT